jgi:alginate O-acetyltransferase complex protein AlgI
LEPATRTALLCVLIWLGFFAVALVLRDEVEIQHEFIDAGSAIEWPLQLETGDVLVTRLSSASATRLVALDIGGVSDTDLLIRIGVNGAWPKCRVEPAACRLLVTATDETVVYMTARTPVRVLGIHETVLRHQWATTAAENLPVLLFGVVLLIPLSWLVMHRPVLQRRLLLGATLGLLFWLQPMFTLLAVVLLSLLHHLGTRSPPGALKQLGISLAGAAGVLFAAKYVTTGIERVFANPGGFELLVPLGISYLVIRVVDTQIRWYRNQQRDVELDEFLFFVFFPATIAAGPVDTLERFRCARTAQITASTCVPGIRRVGWGVFKKLVVADALLLPMLWSDHGYAFSVFAPDQSDPTMVVGFLFVALAYVYVDFSAYSDIAIGLSRLMGWSAPENFDFPFLARSIMDYWRRWHMSVSAWCMRNIYMPLLLSTRRPVIASMMVMLGVGMWHSIGLSWMLWAAHHGFLVAIESSWVRWRRKARKSKRAQVAQQGWRSHLLSVPARVGTITWVAAGHAFAQIEDPGTALDLYIRFWIGIMAILASLF